MASTSSKPLINLLKGWPNPGLLPTISFRAAADEALARPDIAQPALLYAPDWGYEPLREALAPWLSRFYKPKRAISSDRLCITGGASQNLACILQVYTDPVYTRNVWMVSPTYFLACRIFEDSGFHGRLRSVPEDEEGIDIEYLRAKISESDQEAVKNGNTEPKLKPPRAWNKIYRHIIYAVPTFSNPSSKTWTLSRREEIVRLAREFDALIVTDDVYDQLQWQTDQRLDRVEETAVQPRIVDVDHFLDGGAERPGADGFGNACSNGSFSKIIGPGCRTGWAEGTSKFAFGLSQCGSSRSGGCPSQVVAVVLTDFVKSGGLQNHLTNTLQPAYAHRYRSMMQLVKEKLEPLGVKLPQSNRSTVGGYFIWCTLPKPLLADEVAGRARAEENLILAPGSIFGVYGDAREEELERAIRLCFAWEDASLLQKGIDRLAAIIKKMLDEGDKNQDFVMVPKYDVRNIADYQ